MPRFKRMTGHGWRMNTCSDMIATSSNKSNQARGKTPREVTTIASDVFSEAEAAAYLHQKPRTIRDWRARRGLPCFKPTAKVTLCHQTTLLRAPFRAAPPKSEPKPPVSRMNAPQTLKIACPSCAEHVEFPAEMRGQIINCPHCGLSMTLVLPGAPPPAGLPEGFTRQPEIKSATKKSADWIGGGVILQIIGVLLCLTCYGAILGVPLIIWGGLMARKKKCSQCGIAVDANAKICPACRSVFTK